MARAAASWLVPVIPMLDGGQIMMLGIEKVMSWFGKTLSMAAKERIQLSGLAIVLLLMVTVIFFDGRGGPPGRGGGNNASRSSREETLQSSPPSSRRCAPSSMTATSAPASSLKTPICWVSRFGS